MLTQAETLHFAVQGIGNPFARSWVKPDMQVSAGRENQITGLGYEHSAIVPAMQFWRIQIFARELILPLGATPPLSTDLMSEADTNGNVSTMLKVEIAWSLRNSRERRIRLDVGSGVDIYVGPAIQVKHVHPLIPDPLSIPADLPEDTVANPVSVTVAFTVTVSCGFICTGQHMPAVYSQLFFVPGAEPNEQVLMPVVEAASEVVIYGDPVFAAADVADFWRALYSPIPVGGPSTPGYSVGQFPLIPIIRNLIPGNANAIRVLAPTGARTINIVQALHF